MLKGKKLLIAIFVISIVVNLYLYVSEETGVKAVFVKEAPFIALETTEIVSEAFKIP